jgi:methionyl-tRNA formyltransferase
MARLAFLGSPEAAVPSLRALVDAGHDVAVVVSQPDKRRGRGTSTTPSPVKQAALGAGLAVSDRIDDVLDSAAELGVVVAYGRIVPERVLQRTPMLNAHFSLLPRWRGAAPVERAILAGDRVTGVSIMRLEAELDTGPVLKVRQEPIFHDQREHASQLRGRLAAVAAELLVEILGGGVAMLGPGTTQAGEVTYAAKIEADELRLDFSRPVAGLERIVRLDRAWTLFRGERMRVLDAVAHEAPTGATPQAAGRVPGNQATEPTELTEPTRERPAGALQGTSVQAVDGTLELLVVQPAGRRPQPAAEWLRGARLVSGERLGE